jgi:AraC-like DNA-binding protein
MADGLVQTRRVSERGVHETAQRAGAARGAAVVRHHVGYEEWPEAGFLRREVARHGVALILGFGDDMDVFEDELGSPVRRLGAFVVGNQSRSSVTGVGGHQLGVQVELTPAGALALFGAVEKLNDTVVPLDEALGARGARLVERLAETPSWEARLDLLDDALGAAALAGGAGGGRGGGEVPSLAPEVAWMRRRLLDTKGRARVEPLMDETGWSRRHVTERFRHQLGVAPKTFARLLRFEHASTLLTERPRRALAEVATEAGYYDQSHLTRDFVALAGVTPGAFAATAGLAPEVRFVQDAGPRPPANWEP